MTMRVGSRVHGGLYGGSLGLLTDLYQVTMAAAYLAAGKADTEAVFHLYFRDSPFGGGYTVAAGLATALEYLGSWSIDDSDIAYLGTLTGATGSPLLSPDALEMLADMRLTVDIDAVPEGTFVFPHEPLLRVSGPLIQCQLLETPLLAIVNFQTLIATKAARVVSAAAGDEVLEFGLRRAQGIDGGVSASRAAYVGGVGATSNLLAGKLFGIPVRGTHAHSWVMAFPDEPAAFAAYADAMPDNVVLLVDTYDSVQGVRHAIEVGLRMREKGRRLLGIRLDSGDLAALSVRARRMLDEAGLTDTAIVASNELDEYLVESLKDQGAAVSVWGVGTKLVTGYGQPALGGVYKLSAMRCPGEPWEWRLKVSDSSAKVTDPGILQVRRFEDADGRPAGDMIFNLEGPPSGPCVIVDRDDPTLRTRVSLDAAFTDLLVPAVRAGKVVYETPPLTESRARTLSELQAFGPAVARFLNPQRYPVGLDRDLHELRTRLILEARGLAEEELTS
jgi:nicotinate phosphoribosyltransferase